MNNSRNGLSLRSLWDQKDYEAIAFWWSLLEMLSTWEQYDDRGHLVISCATLARETGWKPSKCLRVLSRISSVSLCEVTGSSNGNVSFLVPNWLKYQETRGSYDRHKRKFMPTDLRLKTKDLRIKKEEERELFDKSTETSSPYSSLEGVIQPGELIQNGRVNQSAKEQGVDPKTGISSSLGSLHSSGNEIPPEWKTECFPIWQKTLDSFSIRKKAELDEVGILRLVKLHGLEKTKLALRGAQFEESFKGFTPAKHVTIMRVGDPKLFEKFVNLGSSEFSVGNDLTRAYELLEKKQNAKL